MHYRPLGTTGIDVSAISFGAGPVSGLMTGADFQEQCAVVQHALSTGVNWFDTAATYGEGRSEESLGRVLGVVGKGQQVHIATKVRLRAEQLEDIQSAVRQSLNESLQRLRLPQVTLLQLHNSITANRGDEPTSITPEDVLGPGGVAEAFDQLRQQGLIAHAGLTGIGQPEALREVIRSGRFATMQIPYHLLNPSAGREMPVGFSETKYGNVIEDCAKLRMGVFAIRVYAAGALLDEPPSAHTLKTPFFPLALYQRDRQRAVELARQLGPAASLQATALRFVLGEDRISSAILGIGRAEHLDAALFAAFRSSGSAPDLEELERLLAPIWSC